MHSAKDKHFRSFPIGTEVLSFACGKIAESLLCDPKGKFKSCHHDLNMLRVKLATSKDASLSRIPPSDHPFATFRV
jgi:hypothetical protein